ncbi:hypothetical protein [Mesobacillus zeae]|uniref:Uncharacterized protein n=1 Tax=Mesobacillus zeae TaxID=1917180 RepID=A0A398B5G4_9BACI|nr:hypothetical protein [Mesobacillus zeae]RID85067.1 hypothetical protein D1970_10905 [Mesobacillus zeae]
MGIPVIAFKAKNKVDRYLCDGPECGDWSDEYLDTQLHFHGIIIFFDKTHIVTHRKAGNNL